MRKRFALAVIALLLGLAAGGYYFFSKVDEVTVLHGTVMVEMNYTSDVPPVTRERISISPPHVCSEYWHPRNGELRITYSSWDEDISSIIILNYGGDLPFKAAQKRSLLTNSGPVKYSAVLNASLDLYQLGPELDGYIEPLGTGEGGNGTWTATYEVHDYEDANLTYQVRETLILDYHDDVKVILEKSDFLCE